MSNVVTRGVRNAFRNMVRTFSIMIIVGLSIGLSLVMLIAHQAVINKINSVKTSIGNVVAISPAGYSAFSRVNNALSASELAKVKSIAHVTGVTESLTDQLNTTDTSQSTPAGASSDSSGQTSLASPIKINFNSGHVLNPNGASASSFKPPVTIIGTTDPTKVNSVSLTIVSGKNIDGSKDTNQALISTAMAAKNNLKVGSTFTAYGKTLTVAGIFKSDSDTVNSGVVVSLATEQRISDQSGDVTSAVASIDSIDNLDAATTAIKKQLGSSADVTNSTKQVNSAIKPLNSVKAITSYSLIGSVVAGSTIILLTMIMIVRERRREIGVLKAIGASNLKIMAQFVMESLTFTVLGAIIGIGAGIIVGNPITKLLVSNSTNSGAPTGGGLAGPNETFSSLHEGISNISASIGWNVILYGLGAALVIALLGSALASFLIAKIRPAEVMRAE